MNFGILSGRYACSAPESGCIPGLSLSKSFDINQDMVGRQDMTLQAHEVQNGDYYRR